MCKINEILRTVLHLRIIFELRHALNSWSKKYTTGFKEGCDMSNEGTEKLKFEQERK